MPFPIARNFDFDELTRTSHTELLEENQRQAILDLDILVRLVAVAGLLQQVRDRWGPVKINSGYRSPALNAAVGGSRTSQHILGEAVDFTVPDHELEDVWEWIWKGSLMHFGQLILEGVVADRPTWIHLSLGAPWRAPEKCGQVLTWSRTGGYHLVARVSR